MFTRWFVAAIHLLAFAAGLGSITVRARAFFRVGSDASAVPMILVADNIWGISAGVSLGTGLWRLFALEKGVDYYTSQHAFWAKMAVFIGVLALELWPMVTLIGWRVAQARGKALNLTYTRLFAWISVIEAAAVVLILLAATAMARGFGG